MTLDEILKAIDNLSDEDKVKVSEKMKDLYKAEDEREIDKIEEEKADDSEVKDEKEESVKEESEEIGETVDKIKEEVAEDTDDEDKEEVVEEGDKNPEENDNILEEGEKSVTEEATDENLSDIVHGLSDRLAEIEEQLSSVLEIKAKLEEIAQKKDKDFGYGGKALGPKKDYSSMTADELKNSIAVKI